MRTEHDLRPDPGRLILRPFLPGAASFGGGQDRLDHLVARALEVSRADVERIVAELRARYLPMFPDIEETWERHVGLAASRVPSLAALDDELRRLYVGALLTLAYAYEAAALTNPSMVPYGEPTASGSQPFVMSARAIGEGHISSIAFLTGDVDGNGNIVFDERHPSVSNGERREPHYSQSAFSARLEDLGFLTPAARTILSFLGENFTAAELAGALDQAVDSDHDTLSVEDAVKRMHWLAESNYELVFDEAVPISEHVISPAAPMESRGMEDARFVRFTDDNGSTRYYATYTAYDGVRILPQLIETKDFNRFRIATLSGAASHNKGMALFPRKIRGEYVALSRHDQERSFVLRSDDVRVWGSAEVVFGPETEWDIVQTGNCGSPIETEAGWLVITHGVGPMRRYVLGAVLLDIDEPAKIVARLPGPFIEPEGEERFGYVPDVVYSCGSMTHAGNLITPFGYSDVGIRCAVTPVAELLDAMS